MPTIPWEQVRDIVDAVLALAPGERVPFLNQACIEPPLRRYVESLIVSYEQAGSFLEPSPALSGGEQPSADDWVGRRIGPYQITDRIGEGGMGAVYKAFRADDQYQKEVAIKVVRSGLDTNWSLQRFRAERQILANLDHPNITRLLDGGTTEAGGPYLVMDFVQGLPLDAYCEQNKLTVTERLRLFRTVCSAVQYAHQNLVIHRDIKPSNILVTEDGSAKLLDFGIAKILTPDSAPPATYGTMTVVKLLTPEYASPEQLRGEAITTASDVYSLGVVLYQLLTGRRPYNLTSRSPEEVSRVVAAAEPQKPSSVVMRREEVRSGRVLRLAAGTVQGAREESPQKLRRRLAGDLDNIVLMALRKEPHRRYGTVEMFSEDLRRHLGMLPVIARADTLAYRSGKFLQRHKAGAAAAAAILMILVAGLAVTLREARVAHAERAKAENRFNDLRELANSLMFDIHDAIQDLPGSTSARQLLVNRALRYFDSLAKESASDPSLRRELAAGYQKLGDVQGRPASGNVGDSTAAISSYRKALKIREDLAKAGTSQPQDRYDLAQTYRALGRVMMTTGDAEGAYSNMRSALAVSEQLTQESADTKTRLQLAQIYDALADMQDGVESFLHIGSPASSIQTREKALAIFRDLVRRDPGNQRWQQMLAVSRVKAGDSQTKEGHTSEAQAQYRQSLAFFEGQAKAGNPVAKRNIMGTWSRIGLALMEGGDAKGAVEPLQRQRQLAEEMAAADPRNMEAQGDLADAEANLGEALANSGHVEPGLSFLERGAATWEKLVAADPANASDQTSLATAYVSMGEIRAHAALDESAWRDLQKARTLSEELHKNDPRDHDSRLILARSLIGIGELESKGGRLETALDSLEQAQRLLDPLTGASESDCPTRAAAAECHSALGQTYSLSAEKPGLSEATRTHLLAQAREECRRSLEQYHLLNRQRSLSAMETKNAAAVTALLTKCEMSVQAHQAALTGRP